MGTPLEDELTELRARVEALEAYVAQIEADIDFHDPRPEGDRRLSLGEHIGVHGPWLQEHERKIRDLDDRLRFIEHAGVVDRVSEVSFGALYALRAVGFLAGRRQRRTLRRLAAEADAWKARTESGDSRLQAWEFGAAAYLAQALEWVEADVEMERQGRIIDGRGWLNWLPWL